jgi:hypothetical protein
LTVRFLVLGREFRRAQQKALRFFQFFKPIKPDLGLKSALSVVNGAVTDATVEKSPTMAVYTEPPPTWPWVPLLVLVSLLAKGGHGRAKLFGILTFQRD